MGTSNQSLLGKIKQHKVAVGITAVILAVVITLSVILIPPLFKKEEAIASSDSTTSTTTTTQPQTTEPNGVLTTGVMVKDADLLASAETDSEVLLQLKAGDQIYIFSSKDGYVNIQPVGSDAAGYVPRDAVDSLGVSLGDEDTTTEPETTTAGTTKKAATTTKPPAAVQATTKANTNTPENFPVNDSPYFIYVEKGSRTLRIYGKDGNGKYTKVIMTASTTIGRTPGMTPTGTWKIGAKEQWHVWPAGTVSPYASYFYPNSTYGGLYIHAPVYNSRDFSTVFANSVNEIGTSASSGCLRTSVQAAYFVYNNCPAGTQVRIVDGSPLGLSSSRPSVDSQKVNPAG